MPDTHKLPLYDEPLSGYWEWDMTGTRPFNNQSLVQLLGYDVHTSVHQILLAESVLEEDLQAARTKMTEHIASFGDKPFIHEARCRHLNGSIIYILLTGYTQWNGMGQPILMSGSFINITRQKETEKELLLVKDFLSKTNEAALVGGWQLDLDTNKVTWTDVTRRIFGVSEDYVPNRGSASSFFKEGYDRDTLKQAFRSAVEKGIVYDLQLMVINTQGQQLWTRTIGHPEFEDGRCVRLYGIFQDITISKENEDALVRAKEEAEAAVIAKSRFLSVMSHEIRTPMNAVIGFTNLLLQNPRPDQQEYLNVLKFSAEHLMVIINDILDVNKLEAGKVEFEQDNLNLKELLANIHAAQLQAAANKDVSLLLNFDEQLPLVKGDKVRMGQILNNLVSNAIKFTHQGSVTITCRMLADNEKTVAVYFEVTDTGIGVPEDKQDYIFDIFSQASVTTTRQFGGTGLGLAISQRLVNLMGGNIKLNSVFGKSSTFYFDLMMPKGTTQGISLIKPEQISNDNLAGLRILLIEDNPINVLVARRFLEKWGIVCDTADNGQAGLDMIQQKEYDLVLMDIQMPVMDGYQAAAAIRAMGGKYLHLPVIALTASALLDKKDKIIDSGINDYVSKPFKPEELYQKISFYAGK